MFRRARASWPLWLTVAALVSGALTFQRASKPPRYNVTAVLRVSEGAVGARDQLSEGALQARVQDLTFTRARLGELMKRHPLEFPDAAKDLDASYEGIRERFTVDISGSDIIGEESEDAPPRSARISVTFTASKPEAAWVITHELVDMLIDSEMGRQQAALLREQAAMESAVERAEEHADDTTAARRGAIWARLRAADQRAASARLFVRAAEQGQTLRFELVDPGRMPAVARKSPFLIDFVAIFAVALLAACTLAGALDPRVIGGSDLRALQVPLLGEMPPLPAAPTSAPPAAT
jgi:hypothetical protein